MDIRTVGRDEVADWLACTQVAFHSPIGDADAAERFAERTDLSRMQAAFDGDRLVATYRSFATELTVPGGAFVPACAGSAGAPPPPPPPGGGGGAGGPAAPPGR